MRTCNLKDMSKFTEEVRDFQVPAEGQPQHPQTMEQGNHNAKRQREKNHQDTESGVHDDHVHEWVTNGHIVVIGHCCKEKILKYVKNQGKNNLSEAACISDSLILCLYVQQHLWDCGGSKTRVYKGQVGEEEVHEGMQVEVRDAGLDDKQVSKNSDQLHREEKPKYEGL